MPKRKGFTLIELLVVIAIIAILAAILFPVFMAAKAQAAKTKCLNNVKQIAQACIMYEDDNNGGMVPGYIVGQWGDWYSLINKYLKQMNPGAGGGFELRGVYFCPSMPRSLYPNGQEIPDNLKRCYGINATYLGGFPNRNEFHKNSELAKATTTVRILETWNFREYRQASKGWGTAYCYPPVRESAYAIQNFCWPPGWHNGATAVGWCDGHVSFTTVGPPSIDGSNMRAEDYKGVMQRYYRDDNNAAHADPWFRLSYPKP